MAYSILFWIIPVFRCDELYNKFAVFRTLSGVSAVSYFRDNFFGWIKLLFALTRVNIAPLVATQLLALSANFVLRLLFLGNPKFFGFTSNIFYYLSFVSSIISIGILTIFGVKIWISNRNLRVHQFVSFGPANYGETGAIIC